MDCGIDVVVGRLYPKIGIQDLFPDKSTISPLRKRISYIRTVSPLLFELTLNMDDLVKEVRPLYFIVFTAALIASCLVTCWAKQTRT